MSCILKKFDLAQFVAASNKNSGGNNDVSTSEPSTSTTTHIGDPAVTLLPTDRFTQNDIKELISLGFTREQVS